MGKRRTRKTGVSAAAWFYGQPGFREAEGLSCILCGADSGNTDMCVPCATRVLQREQRESDPDDPR